MSTGPRILAFAGSLRRESLNKKLSRLAAEAARAAGAEVTWIDLRDFSIPLYDGDLEQRDGLPPDVQRLRKEMIGHQAFFLTSPEYNSSVPGVLKNAIDWASRAAPGDPPLLCFRGKICALTSASPGALGGLRSLIHLRSLLMNIGTLVIPDQLAVSRAHEAFDENGRLKDEKQRASLERIARELVRVTTRLAT